LFNVPASSRVLQVVEPLIDFCLSKLVPSIADLRTQQNDRRWVFRSIEMPESSNAGWDGLGDVGSAMRGALVLLGDQLGSYQALAAQWPGARTSS
jgi:hypothetical protein